MKSARQGYFQRTLKVKKHIEEKSVLVYMSLKAQIEIVT